MTGRQHMSRTDRVALGLFAAWCLNDLEELMTMRSGSRAALRRVPAAVPVPAAVRDRGLSQEHVALAIVMMGSLMAAASALGARTRFRDPISRTVLEGFGLHGITHIAASVAARGYTSGVLTAPIVVIPFWVHARRVLRDDGAAAPSPAALAAAGALLMPIMLAVHALAHAVLGEDSAGRVPGLPVG